MNETLLYAYDYEEHEIIEFDMNKIIDWLNEFNPDMLFSISKEQLPDEVKTK